MTGNNNPVGAGSRRYKPVSGFFTWDIKQNRVFGDPALAEYFGHDPEDATQGLPIEEFEKNMHPEDRERVSRAIREAVSRHTPFRERYRVITRGNGVRHISADGQCHYSSTGEPIQFPGWFVDVTEGEGSDFISLRIAAYFVEQARDAVSAGNHELVSYLMEMALAEINDKLSGGKLDGKGAH